METVKLKRSSLWLRRQCEMLCLKQLCQKTEYPRSSTPPKDLSMPTQVRRTTWREKELTFQWMVKDPQQTIFGSSAAGTTIKYSNICLNPFDTGLELYQGVQTKIEYYHQKKHQGIGMKPNDSYYKSLNQNAA